MHNYSLAELHLCLDVSQNTRKKVPREAHIPLADSHQAPLPLLQPPSTCTPLPLKMSEQNIVPLSNRVRDLL